MSEQPDDSQKTEEPTGKRLGEARERGQVPTSKETSSWVLLFAATLAVAMIGPGLSASFTEMMLRFVEAPHSLPMDTPITVGAVLYDTLVQTTLLLTVPLGLFFVVAILTGIGQNGLVYAPKALEPKLDKLSPLTGVKRLFSGRNMVEFLKGNLKLILVGAIGTIILIPEIDRLDVLVTLPPVDILTEIRVLTVEMMIGMLAVYFVLASVDYD
jgi:flagellar biosynthetic protein FlhB